MSCHGQKDTDITLLALGQVHNATEPCGCTTEPLGDVARVAHLFKSCKDPALLLDAGGLRYAPGALSPEQQPQARLKADFLERTWADLAAVVTLQPEDLRDGLEALRGTHRVVANLQGLPPGIFPPYEIRQLGGVKIGMIGLADPQAPWPAGLSAGDPIAAAREGQQKLRAQGAGLVVALTGLPRPAARRLGRAVQGLDVIVAGGDLDDKGIAEPEMVNGALLCVPAKEAGRVVRIDLHLVPGHPGLTLYRDPEGQQRQAARLREKQDLLTEQLARLQRDPAADPAFVKTTREELDRLRLALAQAGRPAPPPPGSYLSMNLVPIRHSLQRDPKVAAAMAQLDRRIGEENLRLTQGPPPPPPPGQPAYVGMAACAGACHWHDEAIAYWRKTIHSHAWKTLEDAGKQLSLDCIGCHATGFGEAGGANVRTLFAVHPGDKDLRNVQCEVCHGPGSLHVASPSKVPMPVSKPGQGRCLQCHTPQHSDTFDYMPYLRDILGPGHGEEARAALGPGVTGHELRQRALSSHRENP